MVADVLIISVTPAKAGVYPEYPGGTTGCGIDPSLRWGDEVTGVANDL